MSVVKFPYSESRRIYSRRPRWSKNGTPEERAAQAATRPAPATVIEISHRSSSGELPPMFDAQKRKIVEMAMALDKEKREIFLDYLRQLTTKRKPHGQ